MLRSRFVEVLFCLLMYSYYPAYSQYYVIQGSDVLMDKLRLNKSIKGIDNVLYSNIAGDPFLFKDFQQGKLHLKSGEAYNVLLRYDIYGNQIHMKDKDQIFGVLHPEKISEIVIDTLMFINSDYLNSPRSKSPKSESYFILMIDGRCTLLIKKNMRIQDAEPPKLYQEAKPAKFIPLKDSYYFKNEDKPAILISGKKDVLHVLNDKKQEMSMFIDKSKIKMNGIEDLVKIAEYYNSLF